MKKMEIPNLSYIDQLADGNENFKNEVKCAFRIEWIFNSSYHLLQVAYRPKPEPRLRRTNQSQVENGIQLFKEI
jgi:hypothetical protein